MQRNLDGCYFRVKRKDGWTNVCFSDLTEEEQIQMLKNKSAEWCADLAIHLAKQLKIIGETFDIFSKEEE